MMRPEMKYCCIAAVIVAASSAHAALPFKDGDRIAFLGDSITQLGTDNPRSWVNLVERAIRAQSPEVSFIHAGISGDKSSQMIVRYEQDVRHRSPTWMFFSCGVNDAPNGLTGKSRNRGLPLAAYKANVETILDWAKEDGTQVIVLSQTPVLETPVDHVANQNLRSYNEVLKAAALARGLVYLDPGAAIRAAIAKKSDQEKLEYTVDGTHPNDRGNAIIAKTVLKGLDRLAAASDAIRIEKRVNDLVAQMTLEEKIGQTVQDSSGPSSAAESQDASDRKVAQDFLARLTRGEIGTLLGACGIENFNRCQKAAMASRLHIPILVGHDFIHGCVTTLPIPLALSCAWDEKLWFRAGDMIGREGQLKGANWTFTPMLDIARDARWGRIAEGAGQDPLLVSLYAANMVRGIQGTDLADRTHIAACLKHYVGYGAASGGRDYNEVEMADSTLRDIYLPPFAAGVKAGALTVMPGFHAYNGVPCSVNPYLLRTLLRDELGFRGFTISDWGAVGECSEIGHSIAEGDVDTAAAAMNAGMDQEMMRGFYVRGLKKAVESGKVPMSVLDAAAANVLRVKVKMCLFENPYLDGAALSNNVDLAAHRALAREAAVKSCVLLKNAKGTLPLKKSVKVAFVGDLCADDKEMKGMWQFYWENYETPSLVSAFAARGAKFSYERAYTITGACDRAAIRRAAAAADVVIGAFGEYNERVPMSGENTSRTKLELPQGQLDAIDEIRRTGKPFVAVLFHGRPQPVPELAEAADAILEAWQPGGVGGPGIADVLFGDAEPYGRLTVDVPRATGQCPIYYNRTPTGRPNQPDNYWTTKYTDCGFAPLYPFGFGLAYTTFAYSDEKAEVKENEVVFTSTVANTGKRGGSEVVQIYVRDRIAPVTRPVRELKGFTRVDLKPGESRRVTVKVPVSSFAFHQDGRRVAGQGRFDAWIAPDSVSGRTLCFELP